MIAKAPITQKAFCGLQNSRHTANAIGKKKKKIMLAAFLLLPGNHLITSLP